MSNLLFQNFKRAPLILAAPLWLATTAACAQSLQDGALITALRKGGYVIAMRHPSSPFTAPDKAQADPANTKLERQLDDKGRKTSQEMGEAFRKLHIPVGQIFTSPTYRAREAVRLMDLGAGQSVAELDEGAQGMQGNADKAHSDWLQHAVATAPRAATNTLLVTHTPNLTGAFGTQAKDVAAGEALIFNPKSTGQPELVARVKIEEWSKLAGAQ
jgi:phosphohistidine phosphatase SixA